MESIAITLAPSVTPGRALIVAVAGSPTLIEAASPSLKPATTWSLFRPVIVIRLELDDELEPFDDAAEDELELELSTRGRPVAAAARDGVADRAVDRRDDARDRRAQRRLAQRLARLRERDLRLQHRCLGGRPGRPAAAAPS